MPTLIHKNNIVTFVLNSPTQHSYVGYNTHTLTQSCSQVLLN